MLHICFFAILWQSCTHTQNNTINCEEKDVVCRSKFYVQLMKEKRFGELKSYASLPDMVNKPSADTMLVRFSNFLALNDSLSLKYKKIGNEHAEMLEVLVYINNTAYNTKRPIVYFNFAQKSIFGLPFLNWSILGIPHRNINLTAEEIEQRRLLIDSLNYYSPAGQAARARKKGKKQGY